MPSRAYHIFRLPDHFWHPPEVVQVLTSRDIAQLFRLVQRETGATQTQLGVATGMNQAKVSEIMSPHGAGRVSTVDILNRIIDGLHMPDTAAAALLMGRVPAAPPPSPTAAARTPAPPGTRTTPSRQQRVRRTNLLRANRLSWEQIAAVWITDYPAITPRVAFRWAHNLSHQDVADQWNSLEPGQPTQTKARIFEYEAWPNSGRRPSVSNLAMLARIYQTTARNLLTDEEFSHYANPSRAEISQINHRHLDHNHAADPDGARLADDSDHTPQLSTSDRPAEPFGGALARLRAERSLSLRQLAQLAHTDAGHLSKIENGHRPPPTPELVKAIDNALDLYFAHGFACHDLRGWVGSTLSRARSLVWRWPWGRTCTSRSTPMEIGLPVGQSTPWRSWLNMHRSDDLPRATVHAKTHAACECAGRCSVRSLAVWC